MTSRVPINPESLPKPSGFSYAIRSDSRSIVHFAGHTAMDEQGMIDESLDVVEQFSRTLENLKKTALAAKVAPQDFVKLTIYVTDIQAYQRASRQIGEVYRQTFGSHYPAITLLEVRRLWDEDALIEVDGVAVV